MVREFGGISLCILFGCLAGCVYGWARYGTFEFWPYCGALLGYDLYVLYLGIAGLLRPVRGPFRARPLDDAEPVAKDRG
jgi:hypothetical protein